MNKNEISMIIFIWRMIFWNYFLNFRRLSEFSFIKIILRVSVCLCIANVTVSLNFQNQIMKIGGFDLTLL